MKKILILSIHALVIWALCGLTIFTGRIYFSMSTTLYIHLVGAPIFSFLISTNYYKKFNYSPPFKTALYIFFFIIIVDAVLVAPVFEKSFQMFSSPIGTWIPFLLIFLASFVSGNWLNKKN